MDSLSFTFLLFASYTLALLFTLPQRRAAPSGAPRLIPLSFDLTAHTSWATLGLSAVFMAFIDIVIDPVALRGDWWFFGSIYWYPDPGTYFGVPLANFIGWASGRQSVARTLLPTGSHGEPAPCADAAPP